jgi:phosphatidate cytidylyltransferase
LAPVERTSPTAANQLKLRTASALVLAPMAVAAVWFGWPWLPLLVVAAGAGMAWEWARLCCRGSLGDSGVAVVSTVCIVVALAALTGGVPSLFGPPLAAVMVWAFARIERPREAQWLALGTLWIALPCVLFLWLARSADGTSTLLWIFAVVWASDIGAYLVGRKVGGPRLAPRWSPRKTWAGLFGGIAGAALTGLATAYLLDVAPALPLVLLSGGLAIVGQFGDLAESVAKRRFGVKDSSGLIPGHGGLLDRLDALLAVVTAVALLSLIDSSVLTWR